MLQIIHNRDVLFNLSVSASISLNVKSYADDPGTFTQLPSEPGGAPAEYSSVILTSHHTHTKAGQWNTELPHTEITSHDRPAQTIKVPSAEHISITVITLHSTADVPTDHG